MAESEVDPASLRGSDVCFFFLTSIHPIQYCSLFGEADMIRSMKEMIPQSVCLPLLTQTETCSLSIYGDLWQPAALLTFLFLCFC